MVNLSGTSAKASYTGRDSWGGIPVPDEWRARCLSCRGRPLSIDPPWRTACAPGAQVRGEVPDYVRLSRRCGRRVLRVDRARDQAAHALGESAHLLARERR